MKVRIVPIFLIGLASMSCSKSLSDKELERYTQQGMEIAEATQRTLGSNLTQKMKKGGVNTAVPFCHTMASPLTDQMSKKYHAEIKRTSPKIRNELNRPSKEELQIIEKFEKNLINQKELKPIVQIDQSGDPHFYAPIRMQKKCLTCHGIIGKEITKQTDSLLKSLYPNDLATGFKEGDLRGIWSITFKNKEHANH